VVDGYGIGTSISNAPVVDFAMDIVEVEGKPFAKRGKWSGSKRVLACPLCNARKIAPNDSSLHACSCGGAFSNLLVPVIDYGKELVTPEPPARIRQRVLESVKGLEL
jgi:nicotinate phosphoribosyltransferase